MKRIKLVLALVLSLAILGSIIPAQAASPLPAGTLGPDNFPQGINPLTGKAVQDAALLALPPAMVSVSNFPVSARPQAGLSYSPYVYEIYIGEGMTRYLAMFYGNFPTEAVAPQDKSSASSALTPTDNASIGPIRSGRLPYEDLRKLYNGFLVMASASPEVGSQLKSYSNVFGTDPNNINSDMVNVNKLEAIAKNQSTSQTFNLTGNAFNAAVPQGGKDANSLWVFYNFLNQVQWQYDPASGAYLRSQDKADGSGKFYPTTDRLTGNPLAFDNVVVLFAQHSVKNRAKTIIDIDLLYTTGYAYLFRDGKVYPIRWSTRNGDYERTTGKLRPIRFVDEQGNPFTLKPGNTWVEVVDTSTSFEQTQPGAWKARFFNP